VKKTAIKLEELGIPPHTICKQLTDWFQGRISARTVSLALSAKYKDPRRVANGQKRKPFHRLAATLQLKIRRMARMAVITISAKDKTTPVAQNDLSNVRGVAQTIKPLSDTNKDAFLQGETEKKTKTVYTTGRSGQHCSLVIPQSQLDQLQLQEQEAAGPAPIEGITIIRGEVTNLPLELKHGETKSFQIWYPEKNTTVKITREVITSILPILEKCDDRCILNVRKGYVVSADDEKKDTQNENKNKNSRLD